MSKPHPGLTIPMAGLTLGSRTQPRSSQALGSSNMAGGLERLRALVRALSCHAKATEPQFNKARAHDFRD
ncbi:hypothetical protein CDL15_Pgr006434 [Punica granatum]|uniref:Uncharacterized protein n=1 Tax=Punica granatum TaxID=22663 RepID=A0A218XYM0_PUNGR|nr:hypothetical protein CDL15_Pgr006434 [Punica granatum]PKI66852.1 hypothetical protein CRG98_012718 [Punica granatum]